MDTQGLILQTMIFGVIIGEVLKLMTRAMKLSQLFLVCYC